MKRTKSRRLVSCLALLVLLSGCASCPDTITTETVGLAKRIAIYPEIVSPTSLASPNLSVVGKEPRSAADVFARCTQAAGRLDNQTLTAEVRKEMDFQSFVEKEVRDAFCQAIGNCPGWVLVPSNEWSRADAAFVLQVARMGVDSAGSFKDSHFLPAITITATLFKAPPFVVEDYKESVWSGVSIKEGLIVKVSDPKKHPKLYHKEVDSFMYEKDLDALGSSNMVVWENKGDRNPKIRWCGDVERTKEAYRKAIAVVMKRFVESFVGEEKK